MAPKASLRLRSSLAPASFVSACAAMPSPPEAARAAAAAASLLSGVPGMKSMTSTREVTRPATGRGTRTGGPPGSLARPSAMRVMLAASRSKSNSYASCASSSLKTV